MSVGDFSRGLEAKFGTSKNWLCPSIPVHPSSVTAQSAGLPCEYKNLASTCPVAATELVNPWMLETLENVHSRETPSLKAMHSVLMMVDL